MRAFGILRWKNPANVFAGVSGQAVNVDTDRAGEIESVRNRYITFARHKTAQLVGIATL